MYHRSWVPVDLSVTLYITDSRCFMSHLIHRRSGIRVVDISACSLVKDHGSLYIYYSLHASEIRNACRTHFIHHRSITCSSLSLLVRRRSWICVDLSISSQITQIRDPCCASLLIGYMRDQKSMVSACLLIHCRSRIHISICESYHGPAIQTDLSAFTRHQDQRSTFFTLIYSYKRDVQVQRQNHSPLCSWRFKILI